VPRGKQIAAWLAENGRVESYVVIDDDDLGIREQGHPFVQTNGGTGISEQDAAPRHRPVERRMTMIPTDLQQQPPKANRRERRRLER
jgi:hypothetical protein